MTEIGEMCCCALGEIDGLDGCPKDELIDVAEQWDSIDGSSNNGGEYWNRQSDYNGTFLVFSSTKDEPNGVKLASYIKKHKLGSTTTLPYKKNPNTGRMVKVWLWRVNITAFKKWYKKQKHSEKN